jgi:hypothetical protein
MVISCGILERYSKLQWLPIAGYWSDAINCTCITGNTKNGIIVFPNQSKNNCMKMPGLIRNPDSNPSMDTDIDMEAGAVTDMT